MYINQIYPLTSPVSVSAVTVSMAYVQRMVSVTSQTSDVTIWKLARAAEHYDIMRPLLGKIFCPSIVNIVIVCYEYVKHMFSHGGVVMRLYCALTSYPSYCVNAKKL